MPSDGIHVRTCPLCEAMCGLRVHVEGGRATHDPPQPRRRVVARATSARRAPRSASCTTIPTGCARRSCADDGTFREVTWDEAFAEIARRLHPVIERARHRRRHRVHRQPDRAQLLALALRRRVRRDGGAARRSTRPAPSTSGRRTSRAALLFGGMWTFPIPDLDRTDYLLMLGANPHASQGSLLAAPDMLGRLDAIRARGGRVVVVDPRRTGTAERAERVAARSAPAPTPRCCSRSRRCCSPRNASRLRRLAGA